MGASTDGISHLIIIDTRLIYMGIFPVIRRRGRFQTAKHLLYSGTCIIHINITDYNHSSLGQSVPFIVKITQNFRSNSLDIILRTKGDTETVKTAANLQIVEIIPDIISPQFLKDDTLFILHLVRIEINTYKPIFENQKSIVKIFRFIRRHGNLIDSSVIAGICIDAVAVLDTQ